MMNQLPVAIIGGDRSVWRRRPICLSAANARSSLKRAQASARTYWTGDMCACFRLGNSTWMRPVFDCWNARAGRCRRLTNCPRALNWSSAICNP